MSVGGEVVRLLYSWPPSEQPTFAASKGFALLRGCAILGLVLFAAYPSSFQVRDSWLFGSLLLRA